MAACCACSCSCVGVWGCGRGCGPAKCQALKALKQAQSGCALCVLQRRGITCTRGGLGRGLCVETVRRWLVVVVDKRGFAVSEGAEACVLSANSLLTLASL